MLGNMKEITRIFYTMCEHETMIETFEGTREAYAAFYDYIEKSGIVGNVRISERRLELEELVTRIAAENKLEGFVKGFRYALNLLIDEKCAQG